MPLEQTEISSKSRLITLLLCFLGVHRFYVGKIVSGIFFLLTAGGLGIWMMVDLIKIISGSFKDQFEKFVFNWEADKKELTITLVTMGVIFLVGISNRGDSGSAKGSSSAAKTDTVSSESKPAEEKNELPKVGDKVKSSEFEVTLKSYKIQKSVNTGNPFVKLEPEEGNKFLILDVNYKNIDNESRMIGGEGKVFVDVNGKEFEYDKSETVLLDGWGVLLDQLNPLTQKNTKLVFKIPDELKGKIYWEPARGSNRFFVGEAK